MTLVRREPASPFVALRSSGTGDRRDRVVAVGIVNPEHVATIALEECNRHAAGGVDLTGPGRFRMRGLAPLP